MLHRRHCEQVAKDRKRKITMMHDKQPIEMDLRFFNDLHSDYVKRFDELQRQIAQLAGQTAPQPELEPRAPTPHRPCRGWGCPAAGSLRGGGWR